MKKMTNAKTIRTQLMQKNEALEKELELLKKELETEKKKHEMDMKYKDEVISNYKESLAVFKEDQSRRMQIEILGLRKQTTADAYLIDEYAKAIESDEAFMDIQKQQIDSLSLLVGVVVNNLKNGCQELTEEGYLKIDMKALEETHGAFDVAICDSENPDYVLIKCELKEPVPEHSESE